MRKHPLTKVVHSGGNSLKLISGMMIGVVLGVVLTSVSNQLVEVSYVPGEYKHQDLFALSSTRIRNENFQCEIFNEQTVGVVLGEIFRANSNSYLNRINESCLNQNCQISYSNCKPWQEDSCGSISLMFKLSNDGHIDEGSFQCLQVP